jgi:hypothetical protein
VETDGFQHLRSSCPSLIEEMLVKVAPWSLQLEEGIRSLFLFTHVSSTWRRHKVQACFFSLHISSTFLLFALKQSTIWS